MREIVGISVAADASVAVWVVLPVVVIERVVTWRLGWVESDERSLLEEMRLSFVTVFAMRSSSLLVCVSSPKWSSG